MARIILRVVDTFLIFQRRYIPIPKKQTIQIAIKSQRGSIPQPYARSATERNFSESANSRKANTTLKEVIQSPDFGAVFNHCGNIAKSEKGRAKAMAKPNMPMVGANKLRPAASTSKVPMIGPVHEKETMTRVKAMSKILKKLPLLSYCGRYSIMILVIHVLVIKAVKPLILHFCSGTVSILLTLLVAFGVSALLIPVMKKFLPHITAQKDVIPID